MIQVNQLINAPAMIEVFMGQYDMAGSKPLFRQIGDQFILRAASRIDDDTIFAKVLVK